MKRTTKTELRKMYSRVSLRVRNAMDAAYQLAAFDAETSRQIYDRLPNHPATLEALAAHDEYRECLRLIEANGFTIAAVSGVWRT